MNGAIVAKGGTPEQSATPNVAGVNYITLQPKDPAGPYDVTGFSGGTSGQTVIVYNGTAHTVTYKNGTNMRPRDGLDFESPAGSVITWILIGSVWRMMAHQY